MRSVCVKERKETGCVPSSEMYSKTSNGWYMVKCRCSSWNGEAHDSFRRAEYLKRYQGWCKMLSGTMYDSETRVYLDPPLSRIREVQLLDCDVPKRLVNFKERQTIFREERRPLLIIEAGTYSLRGLHATFLNDTENAKLAIIEPDAADYLYSNKGYKVNLSRGLQIVLRDPEEIVSGRLYPLNVRMKGPLKLLCNLVDNRSSYSSSGRVR